MQGAADQRPLRAFPFTVLGELGHAPDREQHGAAWWCALIGQAGRRVPDEKAQQTQRLQSPAQALGMGLDLHRAVGGDQADEERGDGEIRGVQLLQPVSGFQFQLMCTPSHSSHSMPIQPYRH
jgi:hypothetical protein